VQTGVTIIEATSCFDHIFGVGGWTMPNASINLSASLMKAEDDCEYSEDKYAMILSYNRSSSASSPDCAT
jgi:hypothetical protein